MHLEFPPYKRSLSNQRKPAHRNEDPAQPKLTK